tara:strand:+ start:11173 stop:11355 length:183 start_codon:yes stop_codon:yes gene_type:complete
LSTYFKKKVIIMGLYSNIQAKRKRIKAGSGEVMKKKGAKGAPSAKDFKNSAKTAKKKVKK